MNNDLEIWLGFIYVMYANKVEAQKGLPSHYLVAASCCRNAEQFATEVHIHLKARGLIPLYSEHVLPAEEFLTQFPDPTGENEVSRVVANAKAWHSEAITYLYAVKPEDITPQQSYLKIETLENIQPLDGQWGVHPRKTVPDALYEPLFGQPEPTEAEIKQYGSKEQVPPMKLYGILDAAKIKIPGLRNMLNTAKLDFACLFTGEDYEALKDSAPYIVELKEDNEFTRILFTHDPDFPDEHLSVHLWHKEPGIFVRSRGSLQEVGLHFAQFVRVKDELGKTYFFRFWEPIYLLALLQQVTTQQGKIAMLYCLPTTSLFEIVCITQNQVHIATLCADIKNTQPEPLLDEQTITDFKDTKWHTFKQHVWDELQKDYPQQMQVQQPETIFSWCNQARKAGYHIELAVYRFVQACLLTDSIKINIEPLITEVERLPDLGEVRRTQALLERVKILVEQ